MQFIKATDLHHVIIDYKKYILQQTTKDPLIISNTFRILKAQIQGGSNMTGTDLCVNCKQSVPVIFEPPCI
jgi:hypothetical protein